MRLWSLHPKYLDRQGLLAVWREALLARRVLEKRTRGYTAHPQLMRFREQARPVEAVDTYLHHVWKESIRRGYSFDKEKVGTRLLTRKVPVTRGQMEFELAHLKAKLKARDPEKHAELLKVQRPLPHPMFHVVEGPKEGWEKQF